MTICLAYIDPASVFAGSRAILSSSPCPPFAITAGGLIDVEQGLVFRVRV